MVNIVGAAIQKGTAPTKKGAGAIRKVAAPTEKGAGATQKVAAPTEKGADATQKVAAPTEKGADATQKVAAPIKKGAEWMNLTGVAIRHNQRGNSMRTQIIRIAFTAALALATASTLSSCSSDHVYDPDIKCGGKKYDLETQYCENDVIINQEKCGDGWYIPTYHFCNEGNRYPLCNGLVYDPEVQKCWSDSISEMCGDDHYYNIATQFCYKDDLGDDHYHYEIVDKCNGEEYDLKTHFCYENGLVKKCGGYYSYVPATQFCYIYPEDYYEYRVEVVDKCGGKEYDYYTKFCYENKIVDRCGLELGYVGIYDLSTHFCVGNDLVNKCDGKEYDTYSQYCSNDNVVDKSKFTDNRDGKTYKYVTIGEQVWMAENLNYNVDFSKCYDNYNSNCITYGRLYDWATAMGFDQDCNSTSCSEQVEDPHQGICPDGWHIPSDDEWDVLKNFVESDKDCTDCGAKYLKSTVGWIDDGYYNGEDAYGFAALPGGYGNSDGNFYGSASSIYYVGNLNGHWWSATEYPAYDNAYYRHMRGSNEYVDVYRSNFTKSYLRSVRCVQD